MEIERKQREPGEYCVFTPIMSVFGLSQVLSKKWKHRSKTETETILSRVFFLSRDRIF